MIILFERRLGARVHAVFLALCEGLVFVGVVCELLLVLVYAMAL